MAKRPSGDTAADRHGHEHPTPPEPTELRARGRRLTRQRALIWSVLTAETGAHLSAEDIVGRVQRELPSVSPSTVYRNLDVLVAEGLVLRTALGGDRAYYEPAHVHPHHHLVCRSCDGVTHVHSDALGDLTARLRETAGFTLGQDEITLFGTCAACAGGTTRATPAG